MAFGHRSFAVGTAYSKTDAVQAVVVSLLVLGETLPPLALAGIGVGVAGVLLLSLAGRGLNLRELLHAMAQPAALCGVGAGAGFVLAGVGIKAATVALAAPDPVLAALLALVETNTLQTAMQGSWMAWREPAGLRASFTGWRSDMWVGMLSACGSACWFAGFALSPVALIRTVGQVEVVFTLLYQPVLPARNPAPGGRGRVEADCGRCRAGARRPQTTTGVGRKSAAPSAIMQRQTEAEGAALFRPTTFPGR